MIRSIPDYPKKEEDLLDVYNYLADNYRPEDYLLDSGSFNLELFNFTFTHISIALIEEIPKLTEIYLSDDDQYRIKKIMKNLSLDFPVYLFNGEIIAGVHRSIAYFCTKTLEIPVVIITVK